MSGVASIFMSAGFAVALIAMAPLKTFAGQYTKQCKDASKASEQQCQQAVQSAGAADAASAAKKVATVGSSPTVNPGSGAQGTQIADQIGRLQSAKAQCEAAKKSCEGQCDSAKAQAEGDQQAVKRGEPGQVEQTKQSACIAPIMAMMGQLDNALAQLGDAGNGTGKTGNSSGGMPPIPPIPPSDKKDDKKSAQDDPNANKPLVCGSDSSTTKYSDCNDFYMNKCSGNMGQEGCDQFISRYCGPMNGSSGGSSTLPDVGSSTSNQISNFSITGARTNSATANLVADKQGEGMGSTFCGRANGYRFCQVSGRSQCPSCQNISNWSTSFTSDQLKSAQSACPSDPMFADPAVAAQINAGSATDNPATSTLDTKLMSATGKDKVGSSSSFGSGAHGTSGAGSNGGKATLGNDEGIAEGVAVGGGSIDLNSGSGGSSYHSDEEQSEKHNGMGTQSVDGKPRVPAGNLVSNSSDVANQFGPNVFSISTSTYRALCTRGRFLHCRER